MASEKISLRSENFSDWYNQLVIAAELADYAPVRGCMVVRPYGWALWENLQAVLDQRFKATGHVNAAFPLFIPISFLEQEKERVEGFSPELAVVTIGGGQVLKEPRVVRPTSETIIGYMYARWIKSYRDLPVLINQWGNVVRWEMRAKLFLRTLEFYWQEGHTAYAKKEETQEETLRMLDAYADFAVNEAAVPVIPGRKTESEKFSGAVNSYRIEAMMEDPRALQAGTSHFLGQNFAKAFDIQDLNHHHHYQLLHVWTTSWGLSTCFIGAIMMTHGDDRGLILPPKAAPIQIVIVPIYRYDDKKSSDLAVVERIQAELSAFRLKMDDREEVIPGFKFNDLELKGVPLRIEIGPKDVSKGTVSLARRDIPGKDSRSFMSQENLISQVSDLLPSIQSALYEEAVSFRANNTHEPETYAEFKEIVTHGWAYTWLCRYSECKQKVKEETKTTTCCILFDQPDGVGSCIYCAESATEKVYFAGAY